MSIEVMKQALEALEESMYPQKRQFKAITALRQAIEQAERPSTHSEDCYKWHHACAIARIEKAKQAEPVAWGVDWSKDGSCVSIIKRLPDGGIEVVAVEYGPPPRQWVGLTDEDCEEVERWVEFKEEGSGRIPTGKLIRYIEAKLKEKNT